MNVNQKFRKAVSSPFDRLTIEDLKPIALGFWREGYMPELDNLNPNELKKAGYLIARFRGYNCIPKPQRRKLADLVKQAEQNIPELQQVTEEIDNLEPLARKWNLSEDVSHLMSPLLKYQTRHYSHI